MIADIGKIWWNNFKSLKTPLPYARQAAACTVQWNACRQGATCAVYGQPKYALPQHRWEYLALRVPCYTRLQLQVCIVDIKYELLTFDQLLQLVPHPQTSRWVRPSSETIIPERADWGQQSESTTLRTTGVHRFVLTAFVTNLEVFLIQY